MHTALEVAIAGQHRAARQITRLDGRRNLRLQRAGVADAIMHSHRTRHEGMQIVHRQVEHLAFAGRAAIDHCKAKAWQCQ